MIARTSGTTDATIAPNANSRMRNVSGIVSRSESSSSVEISSLMSSLMNVLSMAWIVRFGLAARAASTIGRTGASSGATRVSSPGIRPTIRTVVPSALTSPASGGASNGSRNWSKVGVVDAVDGALAARELADDPVDGGLERRVGGGAGPAADDDEELLERVVRAAGVEDVVGLARLELALVRVLVRVRRVDPADRQADDEHPDRRDEPEEHDRPAMAGAPHRDADGRRLAAAAMEGLVGWSSSAV